MPVTPTYPGVYIQEIPSGVRAIIGVSTSVAAFVGRFARGPQDAPVQFFNSGDFERRMGGLLRESETTYAVQQFFLNGGSQAWAVRVAPRAAEAALVVMEDIDGNPVLRATAGQQVGDRCRRSGAWGNNLRIDIDYASRDPDNEFNLSVSEIREEDGREVVVRSEDFRNLSMDAARTNFALAVVNDGSTLIQLSQDSGWIPALPALPERPAPTGTSSGAAISLASLSNTDSTITMTIDADPAVDVEIAAADLPASPAAAPQRARVRDPRGRAYRPALRPGGGPVREWSPARAARPYRRQLRARVDRHLRRQRRQPRRDACPARCTTPPFRMSSSTGSAAPT